ncbi:hypothetical protein [Agromyces humi]|uniref:hypothetical protein n=1 Tax=Agromyces humi TaxID=1766800 RepID=UPI0013595866|nr:hypothetical protein [Agromyces humi]
MADTRTVHATHPDGTQVVRYDRAGKWFEEHPARQYRRLHLWDAVRRSLELEADGGQILLGRHGGTRFDAKVREERIQRAKAVRAANPDVCGALIPRRVRPDEYVWEPCQKPFAHDDRGHSPELPA